MSSKADIVIKSSTIFTGNTLEPVAGAVVIRDGRIIDVLSEHEADEQKNMFVRSNTAEKLGICPKCGGDVVKGKFGAYCKKKCGMNVSRALGVPLSDTQIKSLLAGKKTLVKGLKGKKGNYDAYLIPEGIEDFSYTKDGKEIKGSQYQFKMEFPQKNK